MVFRQWMLKDMKENIEHFLHPVNSGDKFAEASELFCKEFNPTADEIWRLLDIKMGTTHWSKISSQVARLEGQREDIDWYSVSNNTYRDVVTRVCTAIKRAFPLHVDMSKIQQCRQSPEETVQDYFERLCDIFNKHSGLTEPATRGDTPSTWESHITNSFLNGLHPELSTAVKHSCIGWHKERLDVIRRHAVHAQERMLEGQAKRKQKQDTTLQLVLIQATLVHRNQGEGDRQKPRQSQGNYNRQLCLCGKQGHLARMCPKTTCRRCGKNGHWEREFKEKPKDD